jgi:hypothetical protein
MSRKQWQTPQRYLARLVSLIVLGVTLGLPLAFAQPPDVAPNPDELYFRDEITYGGTGCPQGSLSTAISPDGLAFTLTFDAYYAEVSSDTPPIVRQFCNIHLPMHIPRGYQYSLVELDYRGYLFLDSGVEARQSSQYYFQGQKGPSFDSVWYGPEDLDFEFSDSIGLETNNWVWSPCNQQRHLTIKTTMVLNNRRNRSSYGFMGTDSLDGEIAHVYAIQWRQCSNPGPKHVLEIGR